MKRLFFRAWDSPTLTTFLSLGVRIGGLLVVTPLLVTRFSAAEISVWYLFSSVIALCNLVDLGFAPTFSRLASFCMAGASDISDFRPGQNRSGAGQPNWELMGRLYRTMRLIYLLLAGVQVALLATFGSLSIARVVQQLPDPALGWKVWGIVVVAAAVNFAGSRYSSCLLGMYKVATVNRWTTLWGGIGIIGAIGSLFLGGGLLGLVVSFQGAQLIGTLCLRSLLRREEHGIYRRFTGLTFDRSVMQAAWPPAWRSAINIAGSTGVAQGISVIYAQMSDPHSLANFLLTQRAIVAITGLSQAPFYAHLPLFATLRAAGRLEELAAKTARSMERALFAFVLACVAVGLFANPVLALLHSNAVLLAGPFWGGWCIVYFLERHHAMHAQIYCTTNHIPFYVPVSISGAVNLLACMLLFPTYGIWAVVLSHAGSNALINNWWNVKISLGSLPRRVRKLYLRSFLYPALALAVGLAVIW